MARSVARLLILLLTLSTMGLAQSGEPLLGTVVSVDRAEARLVLRVGSGDEERELNLGLGESATGEELRIGQLVRVWLQEAGAAEVEQQVVRSVMAVGGARRDPTGVRARIGRAAAGRAPGGGRRGR